MRALGLQHRRHNRGGVTESVAFAPTMNGGWRICDVRGARCDVQKVAVPRQVFRPPRPSINLPLPGSASGAAAMPETRSNFDIGQSLKNLDGDITTACNGLVDVSAGLRAKHSELLALTRKMQQELVLKQAELDRRTSQHKRDVLSHKECADRAMRKVQATAKMLHKYRLEIQSLRLQNQNLTGDLEAKTKRLLCNICVDRSKDVVTKCGHSFCKSCVTTWLRQPDEDAADDLDLDSPPPTKATCPICRKLLDEKDDVWPLFNENTEPEVTYVDSDSG